MLIPDCFLSFVVVDFTFPFDDAEEWPRFLEMALLWERETAPELASSHTSDSPCSSTT